MPPIPSRDDDGSAGNADLSTCGVAGVTGRCRGLVGGTDSTGRCSRSCATVSVLRQPSGVTSPQGISGFGLHITLDLRKESHIPNRLSTATLGPSKLGGCTRRAALGTVSFEFRFPDPSITQAIWPRHVGAAAADLATSKFAKILGLAFAVYQDCDGYAGR